jgi:hypothetical protein
MIDSDLLQREQRVWYRIAGHQIALMLPDGVSADRLFPSFRPFRCESDGQQQAICSIRLLDQPVEDDREPYKMLHEEVGFIGNWFCLKETSQQYIIDIQFIENSAICRMTADKTFSNVTVYADPNVKYAVNLLSFLTSIAFAQAAVQHKTLLLHASVVEKDGQGYAFLGKSGTGKSTHSALWIKYIEGVSLLNDDNPAIRIEADGSVNIYGTPWSGKTPCYQNRKAALASLVRLEQAPVNRYVRKTGVEALITLIPSCSSLRWNELLYAAHCNLCAEVIDKVNVGFLQCLPDKEAALLCYAESK